MRAADSPNPLEPEEVEGSMGRELAGGGDQRMGGQELSTRALRL